LEPFWQLYPVLPQKSLVVGVLLEEVSLVLVVVVVFGLLLVIQPIVVLLAAIVAEVTVDFANFVDLQHQQLH
jgi:hypothetical protein